MEGLSLCNEFRLDKLRDEQRDIGEQLGSFSDQYSFRKTDVAPSIERKQKEKSGKSHKPRPFKPYPKYKKNKPSTSKPYKSKPQTSNKMPIGCYKWQNVPLCQDCSVKQEFQKLK